MDRRQTLNFLEAFTTAKCPNGKSISEDILDRNRMKDCLIFNSVDLLVMSALKHVLKELAELKKK